MNAAKILALAFCLFAAPVLAQHVPNGRNCDTSCFDSQDANTKSFGAAGTVGTSYPSAEKPTNFSLVTAASIVQPAQQTGPAAATQTFTGAVSANTLTIGAGGLSGGSLPAGTQILANGLGGCGATPVATAPGNCPVVMSGSGTASGSVYTISGLTSQSFATGTIKTIPLGLNEIALVSWDSARFRQWDSGTVLACVLANHISGIIRVDFYLDGATTAVSATTPTRRSESGALDYCVGAPTSLFNGHNGMHMINAVVIPVVGWPVVLQSKQHVVASASANVFTIKGFTPVNSNAVGGGSFFTDSSRFYQITGSSDNATFQNAFTDNSTNISGRTDNFHGVYCVLPTDESNFSLVQASWTTRVGIPRPNPTPTCSTQMVGGGTSGTNTITFTANPVNNGGGVPVKGQTITGSGITGTGIITSVTGITPTFTVVYSGTALSSTTTGQTYTMSGTIPATASGANFDLTEFHAGTLNSRIPNQNKGSFWFIVNDPANGAQITETKAYASLTGTNTTTPATSAAPAPTLQVAMQSITPTMGAGVFFANNNPSSSPYYNTQALSTVGSCTNFTKAGNTSGAVPFTVGMPLKYDGQTVANGIFVMDGVYFVKTAASDVLTLSATPGGPCINDTNLVTAVDPTYGLTAVLLFDYGETTLLAMHTGSGLNTFAYGDFTGTPTQFAGNFTRIARFAYPRITWDPITAKEYNVAIDRVGAGSTNSFNASSGLGLENLRVNINSIHPSAVVHLTQDIARGSTISSISFLASELPANFPLIVQGAPAQGTRPTQVIPSGNGCLQTSGSSQTVMVPGPSIPPPVGPTQTLPLLGVTGGSVGTGVTSPTIPVMVALEECEIGTPVVLADYWNYEGPANLAGGSLINIWFDNAGFISPNPYLSIVNGAGAAQLAGQGILGNLTATNYTTVNFAQGMSFISYMANDLMLGATSAGTKGGSWTITNTLMDRSGPQGYAAYDQAYAALNGGVQFNSYGVEEAAIYQTATATLAQSGNTVTLTGISGLTYPGMAVSGTGCTGEVLWQNTSNSGGTQTWIVDGSATIASCSATLVRAIWHLGPPGNTTPGVYYPPPILDSTTNAMWSCSGGVLQSNQQAVWRISHENSTVIVSALPTGPCPLDGNSHLIIMSPAHIDLFTQLAQNDGFQTGMNVSGLNIVNSMGYGFTVLQNAGHFSQVLNTYEGDSFVHNYPTVVGQGTYNDVVTSNMTNRNMLFRTDDFRQIGDTTAQINLNGTFVWDGVNCGSSPSVFTTLGQTKSGIVVRNTGWPGQGSSPAGSC